MWAWLLVMIFRFLAWRPLCFCLHGTGVCGFSEGCFRHLSMFICRDDFYCSQPDRRWFVRMNMFCVVSSLAGLWPAWFLRGFVLFLSRVEWGSHLIKTMQQIKNCRCFYSFLMAKELNTVATQQGRAPPRWIISCYWCLLNFLMGYNHCLYGMQQIKFGFLEINCFMANLLWCIRSGHFITILLEGPLSTPWSKSIIPFPKVWFPCFNLKLVVELNLIPWIL